MHEETALDESHSIITFDTKTRSFGLGSSKIFCSTFLFFGTLDQAVTYTCQDAHMEQGIKCRVNVTGGRDSDNLGYCF